MILFLCPLAPALWDKFDHDNYPILVEIETYAKQEAQKFNLVITGSYNPYNVGIDNYDFFDSRHARYESLSKYFDFGE